MASDFFNTWIWYCGIPISWLLLIDVSGIYFEAQGWVCKPEDFCSIIENKWQNPYCWQIKELD